MPLRLRWAGHTQDDFIAIDQFWSARAPHILTSVIQAINERAEWVSADNYLLGQRTPGLGPEHRSVLERRFGYRIYYRVHGDPPHTLTVYTIRHARQQPPRATTPDRYSRT
jgi:hypothetical protein